MPENNPTRDESVRHASLVERLRAGTGDGLHAFDMMNVAADRIEQLEAALRWIEGMPLPVPPLDDPAHNMRTIARRALASENK